MSCETRIIIDFTAVHIRSSFCYMVFLLTTISTTLIYLIIYLCFVLA